MRAAAKDSRKMITITCILTERAHLVISYENMAMIHINGCSVFSNNPKSDEHFFGYVVSEAKKNYF